MANYGLHVAADGTILLNDKPFYGYGLNIYHSFQWTVDGYYEGEEREFYKEDIRLCKAYHMPVARMPFSSWGDRCYRLFDEEPEAFFSILDKVVEEAERQQLGLIASLLWNQDTLPYYVGEKRSAIGDINSRTMAFAKRYIGAIVRRYKNSPAIWGWEIGNEYNLTADLYKKDFSAHLPHDCFKIGKWSMADYYTSADLRLFYTELAGVIRAEDPYRMITNGNAIMRAHAKYLRQKAVAEMQQEKVSDRPETEVQYDTFEEFCEMNAWMCPDPMDTVSYHFQHATWRGNPPAYTMEHIMGGQKVDTHGYIEGYVEMGRRLKKATYYGEFGDFCDMETDELRQSEWENMTAHWKTLLQAMKDAGVQLATGWLPFAPAGDGRFNHTLDGMRPGYFNEVRMPDLKEANEEFVARGLQCTDEYWATACATV